VHGRIIMRAYSYDFWSHLLRAVDQGTRKPEAARILGVSTRTIEWYLQRRRETGDVQPRPIAGRPRHISPAQDAELWRQLAQHPRATLVEHCTLWQVVSGQMVSTATMSRQIHLTCPACWRSSGEGAILTASSYPGSAWDSICRAALSRTMAENCDWFRDWARVRWRPLIWR
jgi:transposase